MIFGDDAGLAESSVSTAVRTAESCRTPVPSRTWPAGRSALSLMLTDVFGWRLFLAASSGDLDKVSTLLIVVGAWSDMNAI
jgi:hypothetical protein